MNRPSFTKEQLAFIRQLLGVRCCHVTGEHDPKHFEQDRYVCEIQKAEAFDRARKQMGFAKIRPQDAEPDPECGWCKNKRILKMLRRREQGKSMPDFDAVCEAVDRGYATMEGPSDDITFTITEKGKQLLLKMQETKGAQK